MTREKRLLGCALLIAVVGSPVETRAAEGLDVFAPTMVLDQSATSGSVVLELRNKSKSPMRVHLHAGNLVNRVDETTKKILGARPTFAGGAGATAKDFYEETIAAQGVVAVKVNVADLSEAGWSEAPLLNDDAPVGTLTIVRYQVPFAIRLEGMPSERPEVIFTWVPDSWLRRAWRCVAAGVFGDGSSAVRLKKPGAQKTGLTLRNDDRMTYAIEWEVVIDGGSIKGCTVVPASGVSTIDVMPPGSWFASPARIRDDVRDGQLVLRYRPAGLASDPSLPRKPIPIRARLRYGSELEQVTLGTIIVGILLFLGGLSSLLLRYWVPNRMAGIDLKEQLEVIARRTRALSNGLDSSVRVLVRVQRHRLGELVKSRIPFSPDWANTLAQSSKSVSTIARQLDLLESIDRQKGDLEAKRFAPSPVAPTLVNRVEGWLLTATDKLRAAEPKDTELQAAQAAISEGDTLLRTITQPNLTFAQEIVDRLTGIRQHFTLPPPAGGTLQRMAPTVPNLIAALNTAAPVASAVGGANYFNFDLLELRLRLLREYIDLYDGSTPQDQVTLSGTPQSPEAGFLASLNTPTWAGYRSAAQAYRQMAEKIYVDDVVAAIQGTQLGISSYPPGPAPYDPVRFRVCFQNDILNHCGALEDLACHWTFAHAGNLRWTETGWDVWHYFPAKGSYDVEVTFSNKAGQAIRPAAAAANPPPPPITLRARVEVQTNPSWIFGERTRLELVRFSIVFVATLLGLLAGARDQLVKLDLVGGVIAVFLLGFSADTIKNMLTGTK